MKLTSILTDSFLKNRGYTAEYLKEIEKCSEHTLLHIDVLSQKLKELHDTGGRVVILPDFDMDGIMSGVLGFAGLAELGFCVSLFMPDAGSGYGFDESDIERLLTEYPDAKAVLTCDVGAACYDGITYGKQRGLLMFVTDHHIVPAVPVDAEVVVDPRQAGDLYEHKDICGAYVLWQCLMDYANRFGMPCEREAIMRLRVFAGIGTVSDAMPVLYENRQLIRDSIAICRGVYAEGDFTYVSGLHACDIYIRAFQGLYYILETFHELGKIHTPEHIDETFFGYYLAPVFNSLKRMNADVRLGFEVFFGADQKAAVSQLVMLNEQRKQLVQEKLDMLLSQDNPMAPYIYVGDVQAGIAGLLATKIERETGMPCLVLRQDEDGYSGSGRSPDWLPFLSLLRELACYGVTGAGHENAFGFHAESAVSLAMLYAHLTDVVPKRYEEVKDRLIVDYDGVIAVDGDVWIDYIEFWNYLYDMERLHPFGNGFSSPEFLLKADMSDITVSHIGSLKQHLAMTLPYGLRVLCWNQAGEEPKSGVVSVVGNLSVNDYKDVRSVQFVGRLVKGEVS